MLANVTRSLIAAGLVFGLSSAAHAVQCQLVFRPEDSGSGVERMPVEFLRLGVAALFA